MTKLNVLVLLFLIPGWSYLLCHNCNCSTKKFSKDKIKSTLLSQKKKQETPPKEELPLKPAKEISALVLTGIKAPEFLEKSQNLSQTKNEKTNRVFCSANEVVEALFPELEQRIGLQNKEEFINNFPLLFINMALTLTPEQKERNKNLEIALYQDLDTAFKEENFLYSQEVSEDHRWFINRIKKYYTPKFINNLNPTQRAKLVEEIELYVLQEMEIK